jgi:hypothetical protein
LTRQAWRGRSSHRHAAAIRSTARHGPHCTATTAAAIGDEDRTALHGNAHRFDQDSAAAAPTCTGAWRVVRGVGRTWEASTASAARGFDRGLRADCQIRARDELDRTASRAGRGLATRRCGCAVAASLRSTLKRNERLGAIHRTARPGIGTR